MDDGTQAICKVSVGAELSSEKKRSVDSATGFPERRLRCRGRLIWLPARASPSIHLPRARSPREGTGEPAGNTAIGEPNSGSRDLASRGVSIEGPQLERPL